jgi:23S rRNA (cytidine1920-2'-O)/16S rRNA (cytidine1409-2'-O)-methyltransferase
LARQRPELAADAGALIRDGRVLVDGRFVVNPASRVTVGASLVVREEAPLRGSAKLAAALSEFGVSVEGRVALDAGATAGGFTRVLLEAGAQRVYAVDVGHGQLVGSLRQDPRVVNLEGVNLGSLDRSLVPDPVDVVTLDLSYLSLAEAAPQLDRVELASGADLVALVKPMFELHLASAPTDVALLDEARGVAVAGVAAAGWSVVATMDSPVTGSRGAPERLLHARRA